MAIHAKLLDVQRDLKVEKGQYNDFSKFYYRSKEDILEAVKPIAHALGCVVTCTDSIECTANGWVYVRAEAALVDAETGEAVSAQGFAREPESKKGMDSSQITGTAASYAGKRALGNLFAIDDTKDADAHQPAKDGVIHGRCRECGATCDFANRAQFEEYRRKLGCCANPDYEAL